MNFRKLKIFYNTATKLNMSKVAKEMYISQPSISQSIHELEEEVGTKLFDRIGKKLYLTYEGEIFLNYTRRILNLYEEVTDSIKDAKVTNKGKIRIGASTTIGIYILPDIIKEFSSLYPDIEISLIIENAAHIESLILENKIDFGYIEGKVKIDEINMEKIWKDEIVFICSNSHKLKNKELISGEDLKDEKIIMREKGSGTREYVEAFLNEKMIEYNIFLELGNTEAIKRSVEANLGIGCISKLAVIDSVKRGELNLLKLDKGEISRDLVFLIHKDKYITNAMNEFITFSKK